MLRHPSFCTGEPSRAAIPCRSYGACPCSIALGYKHGAPNGACKISAHRSLDRAQQVPIRFDCLELRELLFHVVRDAKENSDVGFDKHRGVIEGVAGGGHLHLAG